MDAKLNPRGGALGWFPQRYSLRALLLLMLVAALVCAEFGRRLRRARRQAPATALLQSLGGTVAYDYQAVTIEKKYDTKRIVSGDSLVPKWLLRRLGVDFFHNVTQVHLEATRQLPDELIDEVWRAIGDLRDLEILETGFVTRAGSIHALRGHRDLQTLSLRCSTVTDDDFVVLAGLPRLKELILNDSPITDGGLEQISRSASLERLELHFAKLSDAGVASIARLPQLQQLRLSATAVGDAGIEHLRDHPALAELDLHYTKITDAALAALASLPKLTALDVAMTAVGDDGVAHLAGHPRLKTVNLGSTAASGRGLEKLPALEDLCLGGQRVNGELQREWSWLPGCHKLRRLSLATFQMDMETLDLRAFPPELTELCLERTLVADEMVLALAAIPTITLIRYPISEFDDVTLGGKPRVIPSPRRDCTLVPTQLASERQGKERYRQ